MMHNLKNEAHKLRLTPEEKATMRAQIFGVPTPLVVHKSPYVFLSAFSYHTRMVMAGILLFVFAGGTTASAAAGALPGDLLYPVKVSINEKVEAALAPTIAAKAEVLASQAERRVEEAQSLAAEGRLDTTTSLALAAHFEEQTTEAEALAEEAEAKERGEGAQVKTKLASSLKAKGEILARLGSTKDKGTKKESELFSARVIARAGAPARIEIQTRAFAAMAPSTKVVAESDVSTTEVSGKAVSHLQKKAAEALANAKEEFKDSETLDATTTLKVKAQFAVADDEMSRGSTQLGAKAYVEAQAHFNAVLTISTRLEALLKAEKQFDSGLLKALIKSEGQSEGEGELPMAL